MKPGGVQGWRTHGPGGGVERARGRREYEGRGAGGRGLLGERLGDDGCSRGLAEQGADVAAAEGEFSGTQAASIRCAQGREQEEEAGEMAIPQTHQGGQGLAQSLYVKRSTRGKVRWSAIARVISRVGSVAADVERGVHGLASLD